MIVRSRLVVIIEKSRLVVGGKVVVGGSDLLLTRLYVM